MHDCLLGQFDVWDIFASRAVGTIDLTATYQPSCPQVAPPRTKDRTIEQPDDDEEEQELLGKLSELAHRDAEEELPAGM